MKKYGIRHYKLFEILVTCPTKPKNTAFRVQEFIGATKLWLLGKEHANKLKQEN